MREILKASFIYRALTKLADWFDHEVETSRIANAFLAEPRGEESVDASIFYKLWLYIHRFMAFIYEKLHLEFLFSGSILLNTMFWCALTCVLAPILPTSIIIVLCSMSLLSMLICLARDREKKLSYSPANKYILLFAGIYTVAVAASPTLRESLFSGLVFIAFTLFAIALQSAVENKRELFLVLNLMILSGVIVSLYGIAQYVLGKSGSSSWIDSSMFDGIRLRVYSTLQNPNVLAEYLLLIIPITVAFFFKEKNIKLKLVYAAAAFFMGVCMILTFSRGGWLGLLIAAALFLVILDRRFIFLGIIGLVALYFVLPSAVIDRFTSIGDMADTSTAYRVYIWIGTLRMLSDYWLSGTGYGFASFAKVYPAYALHAVAAPHSHNLFLQITCDSGIMGLIVFLLLMFSFFRTLGGCVKRTEDSEIRYVMIGCICAVIGFLAQSMTDYTFYNYRVMLMFWAVVALGLAAARISKNAEGDE